MPIRNDPLTNGEIYHVFNKTADKKEVFLNNLYAGGFYDRLIYYRSTKATYSFSILNRLKQAELQSIDFEVRLPEHFQADVLNYSLMPNHYHLLLKQNKDNGITNFVSKTTNSFTKYVNGKEQRQGQIFLKDFTAVRILSNEQLIHTSRYIDLNYYSSGLVKNLEELTTLKWTGFPAYLGLKKDRLINTDFILGMFKDSEEYKRFVFDRADYQKSLEIIKHVEKFK